MAQTSARSSAKINALVVSTDATASTITVRDAATGATADTSRSDGHDSLTLPVETKAAAMLKDIKAGDRVMLTCRESASATGSAGSTSSTGSETVKGSSSVTTKSGETVSGKGSATVAGDTGWSMAKSGKCAAVTDISKSRATTHDTESTTKSKSSTGTSSTGSSNTTPDKSAPQPKY